jgi:hypothetical protein
MKPSWAVGTAAAAVAAGMLLLGGCASSPAESLSAAERAAVPATRLVDVDYTGSALLPSPLHTEAGTVQLQVRNRSEAEVEVALTGGDVARTRTLSASKRGSLTVDLVAGTYTVRVTPLEDEPGDTADAVLIVR